MVPRLTFVDFMYAIVVGSAFRLIAPPPDKPLELSFRFLGILFLLLVVLEDYYLYHTQILKPSQPHQSSLSDFWVLVLEIGILLAWYLSTIAFPANPKVFLAAFSTFYALKWLAGLTHFAATAQLRSWRFYRYFSFFIPLTGCVGILFVDADGGLISPLVLGLLAGAWFVQVAIWWTVTKRWAQST